MYAIEPKRWSKWFAVEPTWAAAIAILQIGSQRIYGASHEAPKHKTGDREIGMKLKKVDTRKDELMASVIREMNMPRLAESVRLGLTLQMPRPA